MVALLDDVVHALADPTRRAMVRSLATGERTVGELAAPHPISLAAASKHLRFYEDIWNGRLDALERYGIDEK